MSRERAAQRFVRALIGAGSAEAGPDGDFVITRPAGRARLDGASVAALVSAGAIAGDRRRVQPNGESRAWLRRQLAGAEAGVSDQHRVAKVSGEGVVTNLAESPLVRLASPARGEAAPFLERHHLEAGERVRRLWERSQLGQRLTMSYSAAHVAGGKSGSEAGATSDMAIDARRRLDEIHALLPRDCAGVVIDVCGLLKGLQLVEAERGWPRRSAKLVLRIGLEQLATHFGIGGVARGRDSGPQRHWMAAGARPERFG